MNGRLETWFAGDIFACSELDPKDALQLLPPEIIKEWRDFGAEAGWLTRTKQHASRLLIQPDQQAKTISARAIPHFFDNVIRRAGTVRLLSVGTLSGSSGHSRPTPPDSPRPV